DPRRAHHLADLDRRDVGAPGIHPRAHGGVERDVLDLHEELSVGRLGSGLLHVVPVRGLREADRAGGQAALGVHAPAHSIAVVAGWPSSSRPWSSREAAFTWKWAVAV